MPYWTGDAAFGVMTVLLGAVDAGLGACILGNFRGEAALAESLGVPDGWDLFAAVALGRPTATTTAPPRSSATAPRRHAPPPGPLDHASPPRVMRECPPRQHLGIDPARTTRSIVSFPTIPPTTPRVPFQAKQ